MKPFVMKSTKKKLLESKCFEMKRLLLSLTLSVALFGTVVGTAAARAAETFTCYIYHSNSTGADAIFCFGSQGTNYIFPLN